MSVGVVDKTTGDRIPTAGNPLDKVGNLANLTTTAKDNAVNAINEVNAALATKQNATDNSLDTTAKTIVGAINEHEGDISSLKSGLTNYQVQNDLNLEVPDRKNVLPLTLAKIKSLNGNVTWVDNVGTIGTNTITISSDSNGYVSAIKVEGSTQQFIELTDELDSSFNGMILTGCPVGGTGQTYRLLTAQNGTVTSIDLGNGVTVSGLTTGGSLQIRVGNNAIPEGGLTFYPMIRLATITDPTFAPYIPSVESRIEAVENGLAEKVVKKSTIIGTTDANGNIYNSHVLISKHLVLFVDVGSDKTCSVFVGGGVTYNYHISSYNDWNVGSGVSINGMIYYVEK